MGEAVGEVLPLAVGVAVSPMPVVAMVLMLLSGRGLATGAAFLAGWVLGIAAAGALLLLLSDPAGADGEAPLPWTNVVRLLLGLGLLALAGRAWRSRPRGGEAPPTPKWMAAVESFTPLRAAGMAVMLGVINPKNLALIVGAVAAASTSGAAGAGQAVAWTVFTVVATTGVAAPLGVYLALGEGAGAVLDDIRTWMTTHNTAITAVLCLIVGAKLLGESLAGFAT